MNATRVLEGRREGELLAFSSVRRMTDMLSKRCREQSWVRTSVATLDRFRTMTGHADLEALRDQALADPVVAEGTIASFAAALADYTESQVSALARGAKIWFRLNGIAVPWRPLGGRSSSPVLAATDQEGIDRVILLALIGSGLRLAELLRLRVGDIGSLDSDGRLIADIEADPLAVQYTPRRGKQIERITFLTYQARGALLASLEHRAAARHPLDLDAPLLAQSDGSMVTAESVAQARRRSRALIRAGSEVNVTLCRTTGDFFREWGLPGSRFVGPEELPMEEYK
jgi:integrase